MKIGNKILFSFLVIALIYIAFFIPGSYMLSVIENKASSILPLSDQNLILQEQISSINSLESKIDSYIVIGSEELKEAITNYSEESSQKIYAFVKDEKTKKELEIAFFELGANINSLIKINEQPKNRFGLNTQIFKTYESIDKLKELEKELLNYKINELQKIIKEQTKTTSQILKLSLFIGILVIIIGFFLSFLLSKSIIKPIISLRNAAIEIGKGNLDIKIKMETKDEIGQLATLFNEMTTKLEESYSSLEQKVKERTAELEEAKNRNEILLASVGDGLAAIDRSWNITLFNPAASRISGWSKEEVMGKPLREIIKFIRENDRKENIAFIEQAMLFGKTSFMEDNTVVIRKDGKEIPTGDSAAPIFDQKGKVIGAIIVFRDISKEKESQMLRSDFAYASHQLRTPVTKALWELETALEEKDFKKTKEKIRIADVSLKSVRKLVEQLLEISEIDQRTIIPKIELVKLADMLEGAIKLVNKEAEEKGIVISVAPIPVFAGIDTDQKLIKGALYEILDNAIQYTLSKDEVKVIVTIEENGVLIEIQDFGIGIPAKEQSLIFTKYFRGSNVRPESIGAGLGLFISREYIKLLGGKIWFKSEENKGTTFSIFFPKTFLTTDAKPR